MATDRDVLLAPRKQPIQARSEATVAVIYEAAFQVLLTGGYRKLTTTRIAERAGVSVGTLYQYFPNREALILAVIERYLEEIGAAIDEGCGALSGRSLDEQAIGLVDVFIDAKWKRVEVSRAIHEPLARIGSGLARAAALKAAGPVAAALRSCSDASFRDADTVARFLVLACSALLTAAIAGAGEAPEREALRDHMRAMSLGYLQQMRVREA